MFTQVWFWLLFSSVLCTMINLQKAQKFNYISNQKVGNFTSAALIIFAIVAIFVADKWWHGIVGLLISLIVSCIIASLVNKSDRLLMGLGAMCMFLSPILVFATYGSLLAECL